jgi:very-short-patch-repair endonuclease
MESPKTRTHGYDFDRQRPIDRYIVDFYCKELKLAIEIDGTSHDGAAAQQRDAERQARLESLGVQFLRFREEDVRVRTDKSALALSQQVVNTIADWILAQEAASKPSANR